MLSFCIFFFGTIEEIFGVKMKLFNHMFYEIEDNYNQPHGDAISKL